MIALDLTDQKFGMLTAKRKAGHLGRQIAWECECECGGKKKYRGSHLVYHGKWMPHLLHCGCQRKRFHSNLPSYNLWSRRWKDLCDDWQNDHTTFHAQCYIHRKGRKYLQRPDKAKPFGPDNFLWTNRPRHDVLDQCIEVLIASGMSKQAATQRANRVSHQRQMQIIWKSQGLCTICHKPREHYSAKCDACEIRQDKIKTPYWLRKPKPPRTPRTSADWRNCPWDLWFNGQVHIIQASELPGINFRANACNRANAMGLIMSVRTLGTTYILQARKRK